MENKTTTKQWIKQLIQPYKYKVAFLCLLAAVVSLLNLLNAALLKNIIDAAVTKSKDLIIHYSIILCLTTIVTIFISLYNSYLKEKTIYSFNIYIQHRAFSNLLIKDFEKATEKHTEDWMTRLRLDAPSASNVAISILPSLTTIIVSILGTAYLILKTAPSFLPLVLIGVFVITLINFSLKERLKQKHRELQTATSEKNTFLTEALSHLMIVKAYCREKIMTHASTKYFDNFYAKQISKLRLSVIKSSLHNAASKLATLVLIIYCAINILNNKLTYGTCVMLLKLLSQISAPLTDFSNRLASIFDFIVSAERIQEVDLLPFDYDGVYKTDSEARKYYDEEFKEIVIEDASFSYTNTNNNASASPTVFSHINLAIEKYSTIAITGSTGSGKSSLFKILLSLYPLETGSKYIRSIDNSKIELDDAWRSLFAYVPQGHQLMAGTIRDIISFGSITDNSRDEDIMKAAEAACASEFIQELPEGLDTQIKERGIGLSEGQLQRLAIARAIFSNRPILLLDEATSALDEETELTLLEHLKTLTDYTTIIVTHRPAALEICEYEIHIDGENISVKSLNNSEKSS